MAAFNKRHAIASAIALLAAAGPLAWSWTLFPDLADRRDRMNGIVVLDAVGNEGGVMAREVGLTTRNGADQVVPMISMPVRTVPRDFLAAAAVLEGEGILGVNLANLARAAVCLPFQKAGLVSIPLLRLKDGRCGGGSTLAAQSVRSITDKRNYGAARKINEALNAVGLSLQLTPGSEAHSRFVADTLHFGYASGLPLYGVRNAAHAVFAKDEGDLELHESALLSAMLLYPIALSCGRQQHSALERFEEIRNRAIYALDRGFRDDPRYDAARSALLAMVPITSPATTPEAITANLDPDASCRAAAHPLLRFEALASGSKLAAAAELGRSRRKLGDVREVRLSLSFAAQARFKAETGAARQAMSMDQRGHWQVDPAGKDLSILSFATGQDGQLIALYESSADLQMNRERELGSLAKVPALIFLAERGLKADDLLCNKSSPPLTNAGSDSGVEDCRSSPSGLLTVDQVWSKSVSLAVLDALRQHPPEALTQRMNEMGVALPEGVEPAYAVAFGLARATPARMQAILACISAGLAGAESGAIAQEQQIVSSYRTADGKWHAPMTISIDLRSAFAVPGAREVIARASAAPFLPGGTLGALGPAPWGSVGKTGTLDTETRGRVRLKAAGGAWAGRGWFVMAVPNRDALGDSSISILPLARVARDTMMTGRAVRPPNSSQSSAR